jgi:hypothetical protein
MAKLWLALSLHISVSSEKTLPRQRQLLSRNAASNAKSLTAFKKYLTEIRSKLSNTCSRKSTVIGLSLWLL